MTATLFKICLIVVMLLFGHSVFHNGDTPI